MELCGVQKVWSFAFLATAMLVFVGWIVRRGGASWRAEGFRGDTLPAAARAVGAGTLLGIAALLLWAWHAGRPLWQPGMALLLPLYLPYGVFQAWVFQGVLHQRLQLLLPSRWSAVLLTTAAFTLVHIGYGGLMALTAIAGLGWSLAFRRWPNVWAVGLSHGVLAALAYPLALGDDPLARLGR
jgi:membrane protease YdiL (CAAX protease family)